MITEVQSVKSHDPGLYVLSGLGLPPCPAYSSNAELVPFSQRHVYAEIIHKYIDFPLSALYCKTE